MTIKCFSIKIYIRGRGTKKLNYELWKLGYTIFIMNNYYYNTSAIRAFKNQLLPLFQMDSILKPAIN